jgi:hypothetical protein
VIELTKDARLLLEWLSKEDSSAKGECGGASLNALIEQGLAYVSLPHSVPGYERISLTDAGRAVLVKVREEAACLVVLG